MRELRGLATREVARDMGLSQRSYQLLEAERQHPSLPHISRFAEALQTDRFAILIAGLLDQPAIAVVAADNKLATAWVFGLESFVARVGGDARRLRGSDLVRESRAMFDQLEAIAAVEAEIARNLDRSPQGGPLPPAAPDPARAPPDSEDEP